MTIDPIKYLTMSLLLTTLMFNQAVNSQETLEPVSSKEEIKNFYSVSDRLASSGILHLKDYEHISNDGFKHVINLIPGDQTDERKRVQGLGLSYQQIEVIWDEPTLEDFETFVKYMKSYGDNKVYVHCQLNWRASTFVYLYRTTQLGVDKAKAEIDLLKVWKPNQTWQDYIEKIQFGYSK